MALERRAASHQTLAEPGFARVGGVTEGWQLVGWLRWCLPGAAGWVSVVCGRRCALVPGSPFVMAFMKDSMVAPA